jgi:hypothetical protein
MADKVEKVDYFVVEVADKPGEALRIIKSLNAEGVNLRAFTGFPQGNGAQLDFVPRDPDIFKKAARRLKLEITSRKTAFLIRGKDRKGALGAVLGLLAGAGINITAIDAVSAPGGSYGAIFWVAKPDLARASKALGLK